MKVYRATLIPLKNIDIDVRRLMALANLAYRGYLFKVPDLPASVYYELEAWKYRGSLVFGVHPKRWFCQTWFPMRVQRIVNGKKVGTGASPVLLDLDRGIIKLRYICHATLPIPKWVYERIQEGADIKMALLGLKDGKPYLALVAEKEAQINYNKVNVIVVDVNSWKYGIVYAVITPRTKNIKAKRLRPDLKEIEAIHKQVINLEKKLGKLKRLGLKYTEEYRKLRKQAKLLRKKIYRKLKDFCNKAVHEIIELARNTNAKIIVDYVSEEARRELLEEKLDNGLAKIYLTYLPRFVKLLENQAKWYGIPIEFKHLPSTICPNCGGQLREIEHRVMYCEKCGFKANRDEVPIYHVHVKVNIQNLKKFTEL